MQQEREPWARVVADAAPRDHIVQLYQDQDFSTAPSAASPALLSQTEKASYWCRRSPTGTPSGHASRPRAWMSNQLGHADN